MWLTCKPTLVAHFGRHVQVKRRSNSKPLKCWHWKVNISSHHVSIDMFSPLSYGLMTKKYDRANESMTNLQQYGMYETSTFSDYTFFTIQAPTSLWMNVWVHFMTAVPSTANIKCLFGIKIWAACDAQSSYACDMQVYIGKSPGQAPEKNQDTRVVLDMAEGLHGHDITCDIFFTSYM